MDTAFLCDAATVREGLLNVLAGGITRTGRTEFPAALNLTLALRILLHPTEADDPHKLVVRLQGADGQEAARVDIEFGVSDPGNLEPGEVFSLPLPIPMPPEVQLPAPGRYSFELLIDGIHQGSVPFIAHTVASPPELEQGGGEE
jgi:uncharacterized protein DUF6941